MEIYDELLGKSVGEIRAYISNKSYEEIAKIIKDLVTGISALKTQLKNAKDSKDVFAKEWELKQTELAFAKNTIMDILERL